MDKDTKFVLQSLAMDLKRVSMGLERGSLKMAKRFLEEAIKRKKEVEMDKIAPYIQKLLGKVNKNLDAENALMLSTLIQNYSQKTANFS